MVAEAALAGFVDSAVGYATHYHAVYVVPYWSPGLLKIATIGAHIFYQRPGRGGDPAAFVGRYAGGEELTPLDDAEGEETATLDVPPPPAPVVSEVEVASAIAATDAATPASDIAPTNVELADAPKPKIFRSLVAAETPRPRLAMSPSGS